MRKQLLKDAEKWRATKLKREANALLRATGKLTGPNWDAISQTDFDEGGLLGNRFESKAFRVSELTLVRALSIANALFLSAEGRGCKVGLTEDRLTIGLEGAEYLIAIRERQSRVDVRQRLTVFGPGAARMFRPTDRLAVVVDKQSGGKFEIVDSSSRRVEAHLDAVFIRLYKSVIDARRVARENIVKDEAKAVAWTAYEALTTQRAIDAKAKAEAKELRKVLLDEASDWQRAQQIRAYSEHVLAIGPTPKPKALVDWASWAKGVADSLDPALKRLEAWAQNQRL